MPWLKVCFLADLTKYMDKTTANSGGHSSTSASLKGIMGSSVAPAVHGVQYMPQPQTPFQPQLQSISQGNSPCTCAQQANVLALMVGLNRHAIV